MQKLSYNCIFRFTYYNLLYTEYKSTYAYDRK